MIDGFTVTLGGILQGGAGAILTVFILMMFTGRLYSGKAVENMRTDYEARVTDAKEQTAIWRNAYEVAQESNKELAPLARDSLETSKTVLSLVRALHEVANHDTT